MSHENLQALSILSEVALGLILFSIGSVFEYSLLLRFGKRILKLTLIESVLASALVTGGMLFLGPELADLDLAGGDRDRHGAGFHADGNPRMQWPWSALGHAARDHSDQQHPVHHCLQLGRGGDQSDRRLVGLEALPTTLYHALFPLVWQLIGSVALGFLVGLVLAAWASQVHETGEMLILLAGSILLCVGVAEMFDLSPLVASLAVGATMVNLSQRSRRLFHTLAGTDPPFYAIFFVIAGADLDIGAIPEMGLLGVVLPQRAGGREVLGGGIGLALEEARQEGPAVPRLRADGAGGARGGTDDGGRDAVP